MTPQDIKYIVVHCSATLPRPDIDIKDIDRMHKERGWRSCGYHYVIPTDGRLQGGRSLNEIGAHTKGHNRVSWGVCLVGGINSSGKSENNFTHEQMSSLRSVLKTLKQNAPQAEILGHRDLSPDLDGDGVIERHEWIKDCPCFDVREWWSMDAAQRL